MDRESFPIGFEGVSSNQPRSFIGFERYEDELNQSTKPVYPLADTMPHPDAAIPNNFSHSNYPPPSSMPMLSIPYPPTRDTNFHTSSSKSLSSLQLSVIYKEIVDEWPKIQWLTFINNQTETYLTLDSNTTDVLTIQSAINQYNLKTGRTFLNSQPEILLIRSRSKNKTIYSPNSIISLNNLYENTFVQRLFHYKLLAIICHSNGLNHKLMFYKDFQTNSWYIYYPESESIPSHSNILSNEEDFQLTTIIQSENPFDPSFLTPPLSALCNHPIVYVYIPDKK